jgi:hypothetical protein
MTISSQEILQQFRSGDPYLRFDGPVSEKTPREFLPFIDIIRKETDWKQTGFPIKKDKNGNYKPIVRSGLWFGFTPLVSANNPELLAIQTGKRCTVHPSGVYLLVRQGASYQEFAALSPDVISYCEAMRFRESEQFPEALQHITKAFKDKPDEPLYATLFFELRLQLNDDSSIDEELAYFENDIDALVHGGRIYELLRYLTRKNKSKALNAIQFVNQSLDDLADGRKQSRIYAHQKGSWYKYKKDQFNKKTEKLKSKLTGSG